MTSAAIPWSRVVKLDEDLPRRAEAVVTQAGYEVRTVVGQGWVGTPDQELYPLLQREGVFFVTADNGFGDIRAYPPGSSAGVLLLRPDVQSAHALSELLRAFMSQRRLEDFVGSLVVVDPHRVRVRK